MKAFSSSILSVNESARSKETPVTLKSFKKNESALVSLLSFNEEAAEADLKSCRDYYTSILNAINSKQPSNIDPAVNAIFYKYDAVKGAIGRLLYTVTSNCIADDFDHVAHEKIKGRTDTVKLIRIGNHPNPSGTSCDTLTFTFKQYVDNYIKTGTIPEEDVCSNICQYVSKLIGIEPASSIEEFSRNLDKSYTFDTIEVPLSKSTECATTYTYGRIYTNMEELINQSNADLLISALKSSADSIDLNTIRKLVNIVCDALSTYAILIAKINQIYDEKDKYVSTFNNAAIVKALGLPMRESMEIFGDEITAKSMFDDLDPEDFNPTEFMDISLVSEHVLKMDVIEAYKYGAALEAKLLAEQKYDQLYIVQEAIGEKIKNGVQRIIEAIRTFIKKFTADLMNIFGPEKAYLNKYKNIILNSNLHPNTTLNFKGDVINGFKHFEDTKNFKIPPIQYSQLMQGTNNADAVFVDNDSFFKEYFKEIAAGVNEIRKEYGEETKLGDAIKYWYGYNNGKTNSCTYAEFIRQVGSIEKVYNWLMDTLREARTLDTESKNINRTYENYVKSAKQYGAKEAKQEGYYYSAIMDKFVPITEFSTTEPVSTASTNTDNKESTNNTEQRPQTAMTRGDTDAEVKKSGGTANQIEKRMMIYCSTCQTVLTARATGFRACHSELMGLMHALVKAKLGNKAVEKAPETKQEQPAEQKQ